MQQKLPKAIPKAVSPVVSGEALPRLLCGMFCVLKALAGCRIEA